MDNNNNNPPLLFLWTI